MVIPPVHPRTCGEHAWPTEGHARVGRFIPAPAGNTSPAWRSNRLCTVHPRTCGEHREDQGGGVMADGSSPHLRGTLLPEDEIYGPARFIPAPAGNTGFPASAHCGLSVHPRTCGEHPLHLGFLFCQFGSSPHLRGTRAVLKGEGYGLRFIPAPAGNTSRRGWAASLVSVHPRTCGEHVYLAWATKFMAGSSPHLRGTPVPLPESIVEPRFIPAPAGNTRTLHSARSRAAVHPRTCGEHEVVLDTGGDVDGSSPHLRGTRGPLASSS